MKLRWDKPDVVRGFTVLAYPLTPVPVIISCVLLLAYLSQYALIFGIISIGIGILLFGSNQKDFRKKVEIELKKEFHSEKRPERKP